MALRFTTADLIAFTSDSGVFAEGWATFIEDHGFSAGLVAVLDTMADDIKGLCKVRDELVDEIAALKRENAVLAAATTGQDESVQGAAAAAAASPVWRLSDDMVAVVATRTGLTAGQVKSLATDRNAVMLAVLPGGPAELASMIAHKAARDSKTVYGTTGTFYAKIKAGVKPGDILAWLTDSQRGA